MSKVEGSREGVDTTMVSNTVTHSREFSLTDLDSLVFVVITNGPLYMCERDGEGLVDDYI